MSVDGHRAVGYYDRNASALMRRYDSLRFEDVHSEILHFLPEPPAFVLDIGAGSGRDARALAQLGYDVTAAEPAAGFRIKAAAKDEQVRWIDDQLPILHLLDDERGHYNFILCSAVLMLVHPTNIPASFYTMARLLAHGGKIAISVRDPVADEPVDIFHRHETGALVSAAVDAGLHLVATQDPPDALGRSSHHWRSLLFSSDN